jgi:hypothetical protein
MNTRRYGSLRYHFSFTFLLRFQRIFTNRKKHNYRNQITDAQTAV